MNIAFLNFSSRIFLQIYPSSCGKSCLKYISWQKIRFGCWVAPSRPPRPLPVPDFTSKVRPGRQGQPATSPNKLVFMQLIDSLRLRKSLRYFFPKKNVHSPKTFIFCRITSKLLRRSTSGRKSLNVKVCHKECKHENMYTVRFYLDYTPRCR